jgi:hypothetical protein
LGECQSAAPRVTNTMRDIAPTLAKVMKVKLPDADGKPLF